MKRRAFICSVCFKGLDTAKQAEAHWLHEHAPRTRECDCPVHHRHDCSEQPRVPTHAYKPHPQAPWFCRECGYPEHERLKHDAKTREDHDDR
jgi:hypothetical protein